MAKKRPTPESFLSEAKQAEGRQARGRLKVFLGAAPGVGKTYAMLQSARVAKGEGLDVAAGIVETHGRKETMALLEGVEVLARRVVEHRGVKLDEFDLDAALARKPALLLVDELAHSNAPGGRHAKRWQDVLELLERGVDVWTTLNIQHLETLNDAVAQITGVVVRETVPDSVLERADVELVDLPPEELVERLREGKVYVPEQAARAIENFFKLSNLSALRELSLRATAEGVGAAVESYRQRQAPEKIWPTSERLLVSVGPGPNSAKLVRAAKRMAAGLHAEWIAVFVESSRQSLSPEARAGAIENLRLAERLGGETLTLESRDVVEGVLDLARQRNVTKLVVGKSERPRWLEVFRGSIVDELIRRSGDIDVYVIRGEGGGRAAPPMAPPPQAWAPAGEYGIAALIAAVATGVSFPLFPFLSPTNLVMFYLLGALVVGSRGFHGPAAFYSLISVLCFDFFFVPPRWTFAVSDTQYILTFVVMTGVALLISNMTVRIRSQAQTARLAEMRMATMHALSRELASLRGVQAILDASVRHMAEVFDSEIVALMPAAGGPLEVRTASGAKRELDAKERSVAQWVFDLGQSAGLGTQTLPVVEALYAPLLGAQGPVGVLRVQPRERERLLIPDQMLLLESFAHQVGLALEVDRLQDDARDSQIETEKERLRSALLASVSHDLRTPLAAIIGSASSLLQGQDLSSEKARELLENIQSEGEWLARLVNNLIETTRLETGAVRLRKEPGSIEEIAGSALERLEKKVLSGRAVKTSLPADLPLVPMDSVLLEQVLLNLLENAARHTPPGTPIDVSARAEKDSLVVEIADRGAGIPEEELERVFEKFFHGKVSKGAGLGLAICRAILSAHGGRVWAENRDGGGAVFRFALPLTETKNA
jgi:two-component system sensor histidine kinase KdpD